MNNPMVTNLVISLGAMQLARKIPFEDPQVLLFVRIGYVTTQAITLLLYYYTAMKIREKKDLTSLKYVEPGTAMSGEGEKVVTTTNRDYDLAETSKLIRSTYMAILMMGFMHLYLNFTQPLFVQALMGLKGLWEAKPVAIHIRGKPAEGDLKRPFKTTGGFFPAAEAKTDKASIEEAEKSAKETMAKKDE